VSPNYDRDEDEDYDRDARQYAQDYAREYLERSQAPSEPEPPTPADIITEPEGARVIELPLAARPEPEPESEPSDERAAKAANAVTAPAKVLAVEDPAPIESAEVEGGAGSIGRTTLIFVVGLAAAGMIGLFVYNQQSQDRAPDLARGGQPESPSVPNPSNPSDPSDLSDPSDPANPSDPAIPSNHPSSNSTDDGSETETETGDSSGETGTETEHSKPSGDPRDPSVIPSGTPEDNAKAFLKLPVSIHDGPPIGGIGSSGIHIDEISTSRGRENTDCDHPMEEFSIGVAQYVNVCFRVVHPREQESLRVVWEKDGKVTRRGRVKIPELHAYTTRAYLLLRPEYIGDWRVRIMPEGEESTDLAVAEFVITE
jgi:hypothetical protein